MSEHFSRDSALRMGDDVVDRIEVYDSNEDYEFLRIGEKNDENFLEFDKDYGTETISGRGHKRDPTCGTHRSLYLNDLGHYKVKRYTCHSQPCPECFRIWAKRQAESSAGYLWAFSEQFRRTLSHWVLSPPQGIPFDVGIWRVLDVKLRQIIDSCSDWNKCVVSVVRHPFRKHCPHCLNANEKVSFCKSCGVGYVWYWSPHLHVITDFVFTFDQQEKFVAKEAELAVIFTHVAHIMDKNYMLDLISYELGHARMVLGKQTQAIRYLGYSAKNHFRTEVTPYQEPVIEETPDGMPHYYHRVQDQMWNKECKGKVVVKKFGGKPPWMLNKFGGFCNLMITHYHYKLTELGRWVNGRFIRTTLPRKIKDDTVEREVWDTIKWEREFLQE